MPVSLYNFRLSPKAVVSRSPHLNPGREGACFSVSLVESICQFQWWLQRLPKQDTLSIRWETVSKKIDS